MPTYDIEKALRKEYINWHGEDVWILTAYDFVKEDIREFNMQDFL